MLSVYQASQKARRQRAVWRTGAHMCAAAHTLIWRAVGTLERRSARIGLAYVHTCSHMCSNAYISRYEWIRDVIQRCDVQKGI